MAVPVWPDELPQRAQQDGYTRGIANGRLFRRMGQGPSKARRRFTAAVRPVSLTFQMTTDELARFERFWDEDTAGGVLPFVMPDAVNDEASLSDGTDDLLTEDGIVIVAAAIWLVQFGEDAPTSTPLSDSLYRVSFPVDVLP